MIAVTTAAATRTRIIVLANCLASSRQAGLCPRSTSSLDQRTPGDGRLLDGQAGGRDGQADPIALPFTTVVAIGDLGAVADPEDWGRRPRPCPSAHAAGSILSRLVMRGR
jgi:hypothetical protein